MSLVNEMLSDLDDRRSGGAATTAQLEFLSPASRRAEKKTFPYLLVLILVLLGIISWQLYQFSILSKKEAFEDATENPVAFIPVSEKEEIKAKDKISSPGKKVSVPASVPVPIVEAVVGAGAGVGKLEGKPVGSVDEKQISRVNSPKKAKLEQADSDLPKAKNIVKTALPLSSERIDEKNAAQAARLIALGKRGRAEQQLRDRLLADSQAIHSGSLLASLLIEARRLVEAQSVINDLWQQHSNNIGLIMLQARLYLLTDAAAKAVEVQRSQQPLLANNPSYYELLALASQRAGQYKFSARVYTALLDFDDSKGDWWVGLAIANDMQGQYGIARKAYRQALLRKNVSKSLQKYANERFSALAGS